MPAAVSTPSGPCRAEVAPRGVSISLYVLSALAVVLALAVVIQYAVVVHRNTADARERDLTPAAAEVEQREEQQQRALADPASDSNCLPIYEFTEDVCLDVVATQSGALMLPVDLRPLASAPAVSVLLQTSYLHPPSVIPGLPPGSLRSGAVEVAGPAGSTSFPLRGTRAPLSSLTEWSSMRPRPMVAPSAPRVASALATASEAELVFVELDLYLLQRPAGSRFVATPFLDRSALEAHADALESFVLPWTEDATGITNGVAVSGAAAGPSGGLVVCASNAAGGLVVASSRPGPGPGPLAQGLWTLALKAAPGGADGDLTTASEVRVLAAPAGRPGASDTLVVVYTTSTGIYAHSLDLSTTPPTSALATVHSGAGYTFLGAALDAGSTLACVAFVAAGATGSAATLARLTDFAPGAAWDTTASVTLPTGATAFVGAALATPGDLTVNGLSGFLLADAGYTRGVVVPPTGNGSSSDGPHLAAAAGYRPRTAQAPNGEAFTVSTDAQGHRVQALRWETRSTLEIQELPTLPLLASAPTLPTAARVAAEQFVWNTDYARCLAALVTADGVGVVSLGTERLPVLWTARRASL